MQNATISVFNDTKYPVRDKFLIIGKYSAIRVSFVFCTGSTNVASVLL